MQVRYILENVWILIFPYLCSYNYEYLYTLFVFFSCGFRGKCTVDWTNIHCTKKYRKLLWFFYTFLHWCAVQNLVYSNIWYSLLTSYIANGSLYYFHLNICFGWAGNHSNLHPFELLIVRNNAIFSIGQNEEQAMHFGGGTQPFICY